LVSTTESSHGLHGFNGSQSTSLRIGFDARSICGERTGVGTYAANLVEALLHVAPGISPVIISDRDLPSLPWLRSERIKTVVRPTASRNNLIWTNVALRRAISGQHLSLFHSPGYTRPLGLNVPSIVTLHDVCYAAAPEWYPHKLSSFRQFWYRQSAAGADAILTDSEFSRREILRVYRVTPEKVHTICLGVDHAKFRRIDDPRIMSDVKAQYKVSDDFLLFVGDIHPRRNIGTIIEALHQVKNVNPSFRALELVVIGRPLELPPSWKQPDVRYLGYVPDTDLPLFYNAARALVYPSFYEGFGFPIVEAMACGCPTIVSRGTACEETAGGAGLLVDPASVQSVSEAITGLLVNKDLAERYKAAGSKRAEQFDWHKTARETLAVYSNLNKPRIAGT
jgi:glycosyltransferase involved in cell wall biosynthesis